MNSKKDKSRPAYPSPVPINKSFYVYINESCSNLNYTFPDRCPTSHENFRQYGAGTWEEIDYVHSQTDRPQELYPPVTHTHYAHNLFSQIFHTQAQAFGQGLD